MVEVKEREKESQQAEESQEQQEEPKEKKKVFSKPVEDRWKLNDVWYVSKLPTNRQVSRAGVQAAVAYADALRSGAMTREEIKKELMKRGLISDDEKTEIESYSANVTRIVVAMSDPDQPLEEKEKLAKQLKELRQKRLDADQQLESTLGYSAEGVADEVRHSYITAVCTHVVTQEAKDGEPEKTKPVWKTHEAYLDDGRLDLSCEAATRMITLIHGYTPELLTQKIEDMVMEATAGGMANLTKAVETEIDEYVEAASQEDGEENKERESGRGDEERNSGSVGGDSHGPQDSSV